MEAAYPHQHDALDRHAPRLLRRALSLAMLPLTMLGLLLSSSNPPRAAEPCGEVWLVSSRLAPTEGCFDPLQLAAWRRSPDGQWNAAPIDDCGADGLRTVVQIHGNNTRAEDATDHSLWVRDQLAQALEQPWPTRWVIWSWPSDRIVGSIRGNVRIKADWAEIHSAYLAWWLSRLPAGAPVSILGHSYGARMATAALHLLNQGTLDDWSLPTAQPAGRASVRLALTGAALDDDWLLPGHRHGQAVDAAEQVLVVTNPTDAVLRLYPRLYGRGGPAALGAVGVRADCQWPENRVVQWNVSPMVGAGHVTKRYLAARPVARGLANFLAASTQAADAREMPEPSADELPWPVEEVDSTVTGEASVPATAAHEPAAAPVSSQ